MVDVRPQTDEAGLSDVLAPVLHPVGSKPARTYWLRRIMVLAIAVAIVVVPVQVLGRDGGTDRSGTRTAPSPVASSQSPAATASTGPSATTEAAPAAGTVCADADLAVTVATDATTYASEADPTVTLTVTNTGARACEANVGQNALEVRISSGDTTVWSSDACYPGGPSDVRTLEPGSVYSTSIAWHRVASGSGCPDEPRLDPGRYHVQGRAGDVLSERVEITLS